MVAPLRSGGVEASRAEGTTPGTPDGRHLTAQRANAGWLLTICPAALEAGGSFRSARKRVPTLGVRGEAADPQRSRESAAQRARATLRRYCVANRLNRLATLTYRGEGQFDPIAAREDVRQFFKLLRRSLGGASFAYAWVAEWHQSHGLHIHFAVGRYVPVREIERAWGRGYVSIKRLGGVGVGASSLDEAARAARYLGKYVGKSFAAGELPAGLHRYEVAQGFTPTRMRIWGASEVEVLTRASEVIGWQPNAIWRSAEVEDWKLPPAIWASWL